MSRFGSELPKNFDALSRHGSWILAEHIEAYWKKRGFRNVVVRRYELPGGGAWGVRSNLVAGLPPRKFN